ncbi:cartilage oligomeric matrix protein-like [Condylostylus longicornis]|uniref:cartilage oligomeric matrix protein-like n=1 Tax=Condylostylus longicornis TaxID=2530218 RepID=UPI00244E45B7|nr:cartilage oligomeric matrix protein-like [Condylostylus longicornis]
MLKKFLKLNFLILLVTSCVTAGKLRSSYNNLNYLNNQEKYLLEQIKHDHQTFKNSDTFSESCIKKRLEELDKLKDKAEEVQQEYANQLTPQEFDNYLAEGSPFQIKDNYLEYHCDLESKLGGIHGGISIENYYPEQKLETESEQTTSTSDSNKFKPSENPIYPPIEGIIDILNRTEVVVTEQQQPDDGIPRCNPTDKVSVCDKNAECSFVGKERYQCKCKAGWAGNGFVCGFDTDLDGWPDENLSCNELNCKADNCIAIPNSGQEDSDSDGLGDSCDDDADGDGVKNNLDNCPFAYNPNQKDIDNDKVGDACDNCRHKSNGDQLDSDNDGLGDVCDKDSDNDGILDIDDNCPLKFNTDQSDYDGDGVGDVCDNCVKISNSLQKDSDDDLIGDACDNDNDSDMDGIQDDIDNCPTVFNSDQLDIDGDGIGDACDDDIDDDNIKNIYDNCIYVKNPRQEDLNLDGIGDVCENDDDNDGVKNSFDNCPHNPYISSSDFRKFHTINLDPTSREPKPNWIILANGSEITQTKNSFPTIAIGYENFNGVDYSGTFYVNDDIDDDFIGFIFGYQSNKRFYVVSWKKEYQLFKKVNAKPGVQISLVNSITGPSSTLGTALWNSNSTKNQVKILWNDPKREGWKQFTSYRWELIHRPTIGLIKLRIYEGNNLILDSPLIYDEEIRGGRLGVYCASQENVIWSNLQYKCNEYVSSSIYKQLPRKLQQKIREELVY